MEMPMEKIKVVSVPDFLMAMVTGPTLGRSAELEDRAMSKTTIKVGSKNCKCAYDVNKNVCKKSKISCDKKCSGKASGVELDGYKFDILVKKGKVTIQKCEADGSTGGSGPTGTGSGSGPMPPMMPQCACVSRGSGGPPTGSGSAPTGSGSGPTGTGSGSGEQPVTMPPPGPGTGSASYKQAWLRG